MNTILYGSFEQSSLTKKTWITLGCKAVFWAPKITIASIFTSFLPSAFHSFLHPVLIPARAHYQRNCNSQPKKTCRWTHFSHRSCIDKMDPILTIWTHLPASLWASFSSSSQCRPSVLSLLQEPPPEPAPTQIFSQEDDSSIFAVEPIAENNRTGTEAYVFLFDS